MSEPLIQIVDEADNPIGALPSAEVARQGAIHRVARIFLENSEGQILLQKRSAKVAFPNLLDSSVAGRVDEGETYEQTAKRETLEELGIKGREVSEVDYFYTEYQYNGMFIRRFNKVFWGIIDSMPSDFNRDEIARLELSERSLLKRDTRENSQDYVPDVVNFAARYL